MKERFAKLGNKTKLIAGALALAALMAINVQVGMNDGSTTDISLLGLEASVFAPTAVATYGNCDTGQRQCIESGVTSTSGPNGTGRWVCATGCVCSYDWVKLSGTIETGRCNYQ
ncbi:MAG: hypothetical protein RI564_10185 [Gracilimonas sp.]|nr:hypothetical protein [Gracilimonas sp.]